VAKGKQEAEDPKESQMNSFLAFDLGASSGRAIIGRFDQGTLELEEIHRFSNGGTHVGSSLHWNLLGLFSELKTGLRKALEAGVEISGMAVDTWGVDYALTDRTGSFLGFPYHYRDKRNDTAMDWVFERVPRERVYAQTGIQLQPFNTLFQLGATMRDNPELLRVADRLLFMPNALTYLFCGAAVTEYTIATTGQVYDPFAKDWAWDLIDAVGVPRGVFPEIVPPCTIVGNLRTEICDELACDPIPVILVGSHDTASAVAAVPALSDRTWAYLSSGTWSLLGVELDQPLVTDRAFELNYTNEGGVGGKIRFLKNIMGLWLVQESRATWQRRGEEYSFAELERMAAEAEPFRSLIDPNDSRFMAPGDMPGRIQEYCVDTGQPVPETPGQIIRCAYESLALRYRQTVDELEELTGKGVDVLQLVGGGSKDAILNQFTANAIQRPVVTGPVEATAIGNLVCQAMAAGVISDLGAARDVVRNSFETGEYSPQDPEDWQAAYARYRSLLGI
jgi:rhamnulokinase